MSLVKNKNLFKILFEILFILIGFNCPAFADGGIPLWIVTAPSFIGNMGIQWSFHSSISGFINISIASFIIFGVVVILEFLILNMIFFKEEKSSKIFWITTKANFYSTIVGIILVCLPILFYSPHDLGWGFVLLGPWSFWNGLAFPIMNLLLLVISYLIEYCVLKKTFVNTYKISKIKKSVLVANLVSYTPSILLHVLYLVIIISDTFEKYMLFYILGLIFLVIGIAIYLIYRYFIKDLFDE